MDTKPRKDVRPQRGTPGGSAATTGTGKPAGAATNGTGSSGASTNAETGKAAAPAAPTRADASTKTGAGASAPQKERLGNVTAPAVASSELDAAARRADFLAANRKEPDALESHLENLPTVGPEKPPEPTTAQALGALLVPTMRVLAPNWNLSVEECKALGEGWGGVIDFYWPDGLKALGPWGGAILVTSAVIGPRLVARVPPRLAPPRKVEPAPPATAPTTADVIMAGAGHA